MTDENHFTNAPDWPIELSEPVARLGPPIDVFKIERTNAARKTVSGIVLIVGGGVANYLYWGVFNGQFAGFHILYFLLFGPFLTGLGLLYAAWRDRGLWVLVYPMGLLRWQRGEVVTFPWDEVTEITFYRVVECERPKRKTGPDGELVMSWLPIAKMGSKSLGAHLILRRDDGAEAILPSSLSEFRRLCQVVQEETFRAMWGKNWDQFLDGLRVHFGSVSLSLGGIHREDDFLPWNELDDAIVQKGKLVIRSRRLFKPWMDVPLHTVVNPHVFVALLITGPPRSRSDSRERR